MFPFGSFLKDTFRSYRRAIRPKPGPGIKRGAAIPRRRGLAPGRTLPRGEDSLLTAVPSGRRFRRFTVGPLTPGLRGEMVQTLLCVNRF